MLSLEYRRLKPKMKQHREAHAPDTFHNEQPMMAQNTTDQALASNLSEADHSRLIEMAWEDRTPFEAIERLYGLPETAVIRLMRRSLKPKAFRNWRQRVSGRSTKHLSQRDPAVLRGYCATQYKQRSK